ncbi:50S ribosomal protein L32 [Candidatus Falkowbacteria bacterium]|jgi:large subunit ribosomal protein L32|nr:50S ribosomal protein L32 [Candidatus Falkowbacteria bacterium]MBT5503095.1 50S ribosomal protein L32 [Candidatus Falkowbacteria bacterium]MBT6574189.1 50S ribosomal protein L32 [Candidatus Falkowbacteria bacterium]MBT7348664.1 50S ribosomal protein L32 [Candidatus Falkowbacteria bacterium]MBT7500454.1 50S ribosomal protein L32 [Candidatus Falkowbacteria bacterium]
MSVPKHRKTHSKTRMGRSHDALKVAQPALCPECKAPIKAHRACPACGHYKGKQVLRNKADVKIKRDAKRKKQEQKDKDKMAKLKNK